MKPLKCVSSVPSPKPLSIDWEKVARLTLISRAIDLTEETRLVPEKKVLYQFTARGHDVAQIVLGSLLTHPHDAASAYYRSRPLLLSLGLSIPDAFAGPMGKSGSFSDGRDIGVVCNLPGKNSCTVLPMSGDVGSQFTPAAGWAQSLRYQHEVLGEKSCLGSIAVVLGGDASVATNGFWSSLTIATTLQLPLLFYIEDNGYGISVPSRFQTPGGDIAENLRSFKNLKLLSGDGSDPQQTAALMLEAVEYVRQWNGPLLLRLRVPRLSGHSGQDTQAYKPAEFLEDERARDPLPRLKSYLVPKQMSERAWKELEASADRACQEGLAEALARPDPDPACIQRHRFAELNDDGTLAVQAKGGLAALGLTPPPATQLPSPDGPRINMVTAIRKTLEHELTINPRVVVFGEDVGPKGGVHAATLGLQEQFGEARVFDTSLSEEGIIGRAVGMAVSGLMPVAEIQFRKYADPATEQLNNCGTMRWRTNNRFAAPIVVRMPGGFAKCGDPWHSVSGESIFAHAIGWQVAIPSNAEDAVGLLRAALRGNDPTIFFEHRHLLDSSWARRPYPGNDYLLPLGKGNIILSGDRLTIVSWGALVERCEEAARAYPGLVELIDLRTVSPWDKPLVLSSVIKTKRLLVVHEDGLTAGFGGEIVATVSREAFFSLDAPPTRIAVPDVPIPYNVGLMDAVVPSTGAISASIRELLEF